MATPIAIYLVVTPGVLLLAYAGPAGALRMARDTGAPIVLPQRGISGGYGGGGLCKETQAFNALFLSAA